jgi:hypothetical protein
MNVLNEQMTRSETSNDAGVIALGEERVAAGARFYAIAADSTSGELEYDRALAAAKNNGRRNRRDLGGGLSRKPYSGRDWGGI